MMNPIRRVATPQSCPGVWNEPSAGLLSAELLCEAASQPAWQGRKVRWSERQQSWHSLWLEWRENISLFRNLRNSMQWSIQCWSRWVTNYFWEERLNGLETGKSFNNSTIMFTELTFAFNSSLSSFHFSYICIFYNLFLHFNCNTFDVHYIWVLKRVVSSDVLPCDFLNHVCSWKKKCS